MTDTPKFERPDPDGPLTQGEIAAAAGRIARIDTYTPEHTANNTSLTSPVTVKDVELHGGVPVFDEPEGGYDDGVTTQPPDSSAWKTPQSGVDQTGYGTGRGEYPAGRSNP